MNSFDGEHCVHFPVLASHDTHVTPPTPFEHASHASVPFVENVPVMHGVHIPSPLFKPWPLSHFLHFPFTLSHIAQCDGPVLHGVVPLLQVLPMHGVHVPALMFKPRPLSQLVHFPVAEKQEAQSVQLIQEVNVPAGLQVFAGHG